MCEDITLSSHEDKITTKTTMQIHHHPFHISDPNMPSFFSISCDEHGGSDPMIIGSATLQCNP